MGDWPPFTSNARLDNAQLGDNTFTVTGVISGLDPRPTRANAPAPRVYLFRCILSNMEGRHVRVLFWEEMARTYETQVNGQVITITRARIAPADSRFPGPAHLMKIEIRVQQNSNITLHGPYENPANAALTIAPEISLAQVGQAEGIVRITGFIETAIEEQVFGNASYGSGAITDGFYRLVVNITTFNRTLSPPLGTHVRVQGTLRRNTLATLLFQIPDMSSISIVDDQIMDASQLAEGFRIPPGVSNANPLQTTEAPLPPIRPVLPNAAANGGVPAIAGNAIQQVVPVVTAPVAVGPGLQGVSVVRPLLPNATAVAKIQAILGLVPQNAVAVPVVPAVVGPVVRDSEPIGSGDSVEEVPPMSGSNIANAAVEVGVRGHDGLNGDADGIGGSSAACGFQRRLSVESEDEFPVFYGSGTADVEDELAQKDDAGQSSMSTGKFSSSLRVQRKRRREAEQLEKEANDLQRKAAALKRRAKNDDDTIIIENSDEPSDESS